MSTELELLRLLKSSLVLFLDELITSYPQETDFIIFRIFINDQVPIVDVMKYIVYKLCPLEKMVKEKNHDFFLKNSILFTNFDEEKVGKVDHFKRLWQSPDLDDQDKEVIWRWFGSFINTGNKYAKLMNIVVK